MKKKLIILLVLMLTNISQGKNWYVNDSTSPLETGSICTVVGNNSNSGLTTALPKATLAAAYALAVSGDVIYVDSGTYAEVALLFDKTNISIVGNGTLETVFKRTSGTNRFAVITASDVKFSDISILSYNLASDGIAVSITSGTGIIFDKVLLYTSIGSGGQGALYISGINTSVTIKNANFPCNRDGTASYGGSVKICGATVNISNCSFNNNIISSLYGGALYITGYYDGVSYKGGANVNIDSSSFYSNSAKNGGAIAIYGDGSPAASSYAGGTVNITKSCFTSNAQTDTNSSGGGAAIYVNPNKDLTLTISDCTFKSNTGPKDGGAIFMKNSGGVFTSTINTCSFETNSAANGEDIYFHSGTMNTTLKNNTFKSLYSSTNVNLYNNSVVASNIKFEGLTSAAGTGGNGDIVANGSGVANSKPEMTGSYTESTTSLPTSLPNSVCFDRFIGTCGAVTATFVCQTVNNWNGTTWSRGTIPTVNERVRLNADYNTSVNGDIDACELTVSNGKILTITDNKYVNVVNSIYNNGTINVSTKGSLIQVNHPLDQDGVATVTPVINIAKTTSAKKRWDYEYMSKPLASSVSIIPTLNSAFDLKYYWDGAFASTGRSYLGWRSISVDSDITLGLGYIARVQNIAPYNAGGGTITFTLSGLTTNGDYTAPVKYFNDVDEFRNFSLLGNPYPGGISFESFYSTNSDVILGTAYLWTSRTYYTGSGEYNGNAVSTDYATFNLTGGVGPGGTGTQATLGSDIPNGYIASEQGFMVRAKGVGTTATIKNVTFKNSHRVKSVIGGVNTNGQFFRVNKLEGEKDRFWLRIKDSQNNYNEILVGYIENATDNIDDGYDSENITSWVVKLHSLVDDKKLVIQGKDDFHFSDKVILAYEKATTNSEIMTIELTTKEGIFNGQQNIYLFDKVLNKYHKLSETPYSFTSDKKIETDRFELRYYPMLLDVDGNIIENTDTIILCFLNNSILNLEASESIYGFTIYDINGREIVKRKLEDDCNYFSDNMNLSNGVYIISIKINNGKTYYKKIIK
jgi:predicted outer membrane repeat protein